MINVPLVVKLILPEFRTTPGEMLVLDANKRGKFLFEWTPLNTQTTNTTTTTTDGQTPTPIPTSSKGSLLARLDRGDFPD